MTFDTLHIELGHEWPNGEREANLWVNGSPLIDLVREAELPGATAEFNQQISDGESADELQLLAGDYSSLHASGTFLPSRNLLGEPGPGDDLTLSFVTQIDDPRRGKTSILTCTCGQPECWFLLVRIAVEAGTVVWSEFQNFHRNKWSYDLGPFRFDRFAYEQALTP